MEKNVGNLDKALRYLASLVLVIFGYVFGLPVLYVIAIVPFFTGAISFCPLYTLLHINTTSAQKTPKKSKVGMKK